MNRKSDNNAPIELVFLHFWQVIGWCGVLTVIFLTLMPKPPSVPGFLSWDKAQHVIAYAGLMWWYRQSFSPQIGWIVFMVVLGVGLECIQGMTDYRYFEYADMVANSLGVICGVLLAATPLGRTIIWIDGIASSYRGVSTR